MGLRFRMGNLEISFHFWFFFVLLLFILLDHEVLMWYLVLPVAIHEAGHLIVMALCRIPVEAVSFTPFSINIRRGPMKGSLGTELAVNLGGIGANLAAAVWLYCNYFQSIRIMFLIGANIAVALFNILPIGTLDGGLICRLLCEYFLLPDVAWAVSRMVSLVVLAPLFGASIFLIISRSGNFTLLLTCIYLAVTVLMRE